jgi:hypothetical protein
MSTIDKSRFDEYRILFTANQNDNRHRLFLSTLWDASTDKSDPSFNGILPEQFKGIEDELVGFTLDVIGNIKVNSTNISTKLASIITTPSADSKRELNIFVKATFEKFNNCTIGSGVSCVALFNLPTTISGVVPVTGKTEFSYKLTNYLLERLLENMNNTIPVSTNVSTDLDSLVGSSPSGSNISCEYYRKLDQLDNNIMINKINGVN